MAATKEFTIEERLDALYQLQSIHSKIDEIRKLRGELPLEVQDLADEIAGMHVRLHKVEHEIEEINEEVSRRKNAAKDAESGIRKYEKQLKTVSNNREFDALNKEVENLKLDIALAEKKAHDATEEIKLKNQYLKDLVAQLELKNIELKNKQKDLEIIIEETENEEKQLLKEVESATQLIEERLLISYYKVRGNYRNGLAVVNIDRDACGGCFAKIPPQKQSEIRARKKITICEHCGRILVYKERPIDDNEEVQKPKKKARTGRKK